MPTFCSYADVCGLDEDVQFHFEFEATDAVVLRAVTWHLMDGELVVSYSFSYSAVRIVFVFISNRIE